MKIVTFGELMLRLAPEGYLRFTQADRLTVTCGGAEANVAVSLAGFGAESTFVSKLPAHAIGQLACDSLRRYGVDTSQLLRGGDRVGIYFTEKGASQRPSKVIYDRAGSAIAAARRDEFDWERILDGADWFHFTGITPALGGDLPAICRDACRACRELGVPVSFDPNYRQSLWTLEEAGRELRELLPFVDLLIANEGQAADLFDVTADDPALPECDRCREIAEKLRARFGCRRVALTRRTSLSASDTLWSALLTTDAGSFFSREYRIHVVDRVGGGDSFCSGLIYAILQGFAPQEAVEFATAASCLKHTVEGDFNLVTADEVSALAHGSGDGRVQR